MNNKLLGIFVCTLLLATFVSSVIGTDITENENKLTRSINIKNIHSPMPLEGKQIPLNVEMKPIPTNIPVASSEDPELHPTIAIDQGDNLFGAYALKSSILSQNVIYTFSQNQGQTWTESSYDFEGVLDYPSIDYWGSGTTFVGTFRADPGECNGAAQYRLIVGNPADPETWDLTVWDWTSYVEYDRESPQIAGDDNGGNAPTWWYGVIAETTSIDYEQEGYIGEHVPVLNFANYNDETSGWAWWWYEFDNSANACIDIDKSNGLVYAAWDRYNESQPENGRDILFTIGDTHDWMAENWEDSIDWYYLGGSEDTTYPSVGAEGGHVYIACQSDEAGTQDIICFYSSDSGETWDTSIIANDIEKDEMHPSIVAYGEGASCTFVVDGDLYVSHTEDGGVSWSMPIKVNDQTGSVSMDHRAAEITTFGHTFWTDTRDGNEDIYYKSVGSPSTPIITIGEILGGFGVSATVENIGTGDAENIEWSIDLEGLVFIGSHKDGTISIPAGDSATIKTGLIFGFGGVDITVNAAGITKTASGTVLGPFVIGM
jgi:hypothetical protein